VNLMFLKTHFTNFINLDVSRVTGFPEFPNSDPLNSSGWMYNGKHVNVTFFPIVIVLVQIRINFLHCVHLKSNYNILDVYILHE
jgi:hypothetical protein